MLKSEIISSINLVLGIIITSASYPFVGVAFGIFGAIMLIVGYKSIFGFWVVKSQMKNFRNIIHTMSDADRKLIVSAACLSLAVQIGVAITLFVTTGAMIMVAFCILLASGYFFEGAKSGWTPSSAFGFAKIAIKVFCFLQITIDRIAEWIAKFELKLINSEIE